MSTFAIFGSSFDEIKRKLIKTQGRQGFDLLRHAAIEFHKQRSVQLSPMYDDPHRAMEFKAMCLTKQHRYKNLRLRAKVEVSRDPKTNEPIYKWRDVNEHKFALAEKAA